MPSVTGPQPADLNDFVDERPALPLMRALLAAFCLLTLLAVIALFVLSERTDRLCAEAAVMVFLGVGLYVMPSSSKDLWPWLLTPLTARVTAAWLLAFGLSSAAAALFGDLDRLRTSAVAYAVFGGLGLVVLLRYR